MDVLPLPVAQAHLADVDPGSLTALVSDPEPSLAAILALACVCVLCSEAPAWATATSLLGSRPAAEATLALLGGLGRADVPNKARLMLATMLGARRLTSLSESKEAAMGPDLARLYRWIISVLSVEGMPLRKVPQPRSARRSAARFVTSLLEAAAGDGRSAEEGSAAAEEAEAGSLVRRGHGTSAVSGATGRSDAPGAAEAKRLQAAVTAMSGWGAFGRESISAIVVRASLRASAWRAKARVRRWQEMGVGKLLGGSPLGRARRGLLDLTGRDLDAFRTQKPPPRETLAVASALCSVLRESPSWKFCRRVLQQNSGLEFLCELSPGHVGEVALSEARDVLLTAGPGGAPVAEMVRLSPLRATKALHRWLLRLTDPDSKELREFRGVA